MPLLSQKSSLGNELYKWLLGKKVVYLEHFENGSFLWQVSLKNYKQKKKHNFKYVNEMYTHNKYNCTAKQIQSSFLCKAVWRIPAEYWHLLLSLCVTFVHSFRSTEKDHILMGFSLSGEGVGKGEV